MARLVATELDPALYERLSGDRLEAAADKVVIVISVDDGGCPHPALLSYFELAATDRGNIRLATYRDTTLSRSAQRHGKVTLVLFDERLACYIKGTATELAAVMTCAPENAKINLRIEQVLTDATDQRAEGETYVAAGVTYHDPNPAASLAKARRVIAELLE